MDNVSVSKGVFVHKGKYKIGDKSTKFQSPDYFSVPWYLAYKEIWESIQEATEDIRFSMFQQILTDLESFVTNVKTKPLESLENEISTAIVLTGVNVPDHAIMFNRIISKLEPITAHTAVIWSRDSNSLKNILEETIYQLINHDTNEDTQAKKSQCTMRALKDWYEEHCEPNIPLVIIITDFESSSPAVLHDFISILSSYANTMKFILIFGVATTLHAIHRSLSYDVTSKLNVQVFHTQTQMNILSEVIENIVFCTNIPFKLTGRAFQLLTDIFLFYDFSVEHFLQNYRICMIQHFYGNNINSLCCQSQEIENRISSLTVEDIDEIKKLPSIEKYLQKLQKERNKNEESVNRNFKDILKHLLNKFRRYMHRFLIVLRCLHVFMAPLPNSPMGKQLREFYTRAVYVNDLKESQEYKECLQLLSFLSKTELVSKLNSLIDIMKEAKDSVLKKIRTDLQAHIGKIEEASLETSAQSTDVLSAGEKLSRLQLKEKLLKMSQAHSRSPYKQALLDVINYLDEQVFCACLVNPHHIPANEIFCFNEGTLAKQHIRGSLRAAIHTGLNDPQVYMNCECCKLENDDAIPPTLPDLSIIYKLHLESRKLINMYDWLQLHTSCLNNSHVFPREFYRAPRYP
ncbi:PREDICTED: origin recognition complex subunit 3 [Dufourea novaeangliae]|uniref:origin recognition complex subunit 3 n=1 Tax=Dufourea novaeangliae TaxID=178035 RepID=UPI000767CFF6|nr:PREDICTED: origin recognition complex subunit 3 [Dufourea novaeangliae]